MKKGILFLAVLCIAVSLGGSPVSAEDFKWPGAASASDFGISSRSPRMASAATAVATTFESPQ